MRFILVQVEEFVFVACSAALDAALDYVKGFVQFHLAHSGGRLSGVGVETVYVRPHDPTSGCGSQCDCWPLKEPSPRHVPDSPFCGILQAYCNPRTTEKSITFRFTPVRCGACSRFHVWGKGVQALGFFGWEFRGLQVLKGFGRECYMDLGS